ncbi:DUF1847 domain-containing protein [candidate division KSB1 bacterium]
MKCAECNNKECRSTGIDCSGIRDSVFEEYKNNNEYINIGKVSSVVEKEYYMKSPRLTEIIYFSKKMGYSHLGIAFCVGLEKEAETLENILKKHFKVSSVCCKVCGIDKQTLGFEKMDKNKRETMCNPVGQAIVLNDQKTDLNLLVGLCIGHDILFTKHCKAPVSTFIVKDRVLGHNPAVSLYSKYYLKMFEQV